MSRKAGGCSVAFGAISGPRRRLVPCCGKPRGQANVVPLSGLEPVTPLILGPLFLLSYSGIYSRPGRRVWPAAHREGGKKGDYGTKERPVVLLSHM